MSDLPPSSAIADDAASASAAAGSRLLADEHAELEKYRSRCFWWVLASVPLHDLSLETLRRGLRVHGGKEGFRLAARL